MTNPTVTAVARALIDDPERPHTIAQLTSTTGHPRSLVGLAIWHLLEHRLIDSRPTRPHQHTYPRGQRTYLPSSHPDQLDQLHQLARGPQR